MPCPAFTGITSIGDFLVWPTTCNYYVYLIVLFAIFLVLALSLYNKEKESRIRSDMISTLGVSSIVTIVLALIGTLIKNSADIPMVQQDIFLYVLSVGTVFILLWFFKK